MNDSPSRLAAFLAELRHRRVFRVAVVYAGVAFIASEIVSNVFPALHIPDWGQSMVVVLLILGFPIAVGMAWAFDLTAEGLVRAKVKREPIAAKAPHHLIMKPPPHLPDASPFPAGVHARRSATLAYARRCRPYR